MSILVLQSSQWGRDGERFFALFIFMVSRDCCVALSCDAVGLSQIVIVVFPDHTHGLFLQIYLYLVTIFGFLCECALITRPCKHP